MTKVAPGPPWAGLVGYRDADVNTPTFCNEQPLSPGYADVQVPPFFVLLVGFKKIYYGMFDTFHNKRILIEEE